MVDVKGDNWKVLLSFRHESKDVLAPVVVSKRNLRHLNKRFLFSSSNEGLYSMATVAANFTTSLVRQEHWWPEGRFTKIEL